MKFRGQIDSAYYATGVAKLKFHPLSIVLILISEDPELRNSCMSGSTSMAFQIQQPEIQTRTQRHLSNDINLFAADWYSLGLIY